MFLAKIVDNVTSTQKHEAYAGKTVFVVRRIQPDGSDAGEEWLAVDYLGAGIGDTVVCGGAPGVARTIFRFAQAPPIRTLIIAIVDSIHCTDNGL